MTTRTWAFCLLALGLFLGLYHIRTDPLPLTVASFSFAVAGALMLIDAARLRWCILLFLLPPAAFGALTLVFVHKHLFLSIAWIAVPVITARQVFTEARLQRKLDAAWQHQDAERHAGVRTGEQPP